MSDIVIPSSIRLNEVENLLADARLAEGDRFLQLPSNLDSKGAFGLESNLIHAIVNWARRSGKAVLRVNPADDARPQNVSLLAQNTYGICALALADRVEDASGDPIPKSAINATVARRMQELQNRTSRLFVGEEGLHVLSIYGSPGEFSSWPFRGTGEYGTPALESREQFKKWLEPRISEAIPFEYRGRLSDERAAAIASLIYELFENAVSHGRQDENANEIPIGVRGISIRIVEVPMTSVGSVSGGNKEVGLYFLNHALRDASNRNLFLEFSIFDSGVGYHRWVNAPANKGKVPADFRGLSEGETVRKCFLKHYTSRGADGAGVGLWRVVKVLLSQFGFIRVRTGRTCVFSRFDLTGEGKLRKIGEPYEDLANRPPNLVDWYPGIALPDCAGTSVTASMPLTEWRRA